MNILQQRLKYNRQKNKFISLDEVVSPEQFTNLVSKVRSALIEQRKRNYGYSKQMQTQIEEGTSGKDDFKVWNFKKMELNLLFLNIK